jgi:hypothetical protein
VATIEGGCITREQFLLREMRIACRLRLDGLTYEEIVDKIASENLIQYPTERTVKNIARVCCKRIEAVGSESIVKIIAEGLPEASAQANLYAMMCTYPLVKHFMVTEIGRRYSSLDYQLSPMEMNAYMTRLETEYENIGDLAESTKGKLKQVLRYGLVECGMLSGPRSSELIPIFIDFDVREAIAAKGDTRSLAAFNCQEVI